MIPDSQVKEILLAVNQSMAAERYRGWDPYDALSSPLLAAIARLHPWLGRASIHAVRLLPFNPRPLLGIPKADNPTALSLVIDAALNIAALQGTTKPPSRAKEAAAALLGLACVDNPQELGWSRSFGFVTLGEAHPVGKPLTFLNARIGHSFLYLWEHTGDPALLGHVERIIRNILRIGRLFRNRGLTFIGYSGQENPRLVLNVSALTAWLFIRYLRACDTRDINIDDNSLRAAAGALFDTVIHLQEKDGAWPYAFTSEMARSGHVDFHQGFVVDAVLAAAAISDDPALCARLLRAYDAGLRFLATKQIDADGAFRWRYPRRYPIDIHNQAQGIISLSRAPHSEFDHVLQRVVEFTIARFWDVRAGLFRYQLGRFCRRSTPYLRWSQAWMAFALSECLKRRKVCAASLA